MSTDRATWNLAPPPGFQGFRDDLPLKVYERDLPHWRQDGATYFVTFRLADSLPQAKLRELRAFQADWERRHPPPRSPEDFDQLARELFRRVEECLDQGFGSCRLRSHTVAWQAAVAMDATDPALCELGCYVIMPNHVHAVARPLAPATYPLENITKRWKGSSSRSIHESSGDFGTLWQPESFDLIIRDEEHLWRVIQYIGANPRKARLRAGESLLWIKPEWVELGWRFEGTSP